MLAVMVDLIRHKPVRHAGGSRRVTRASQKIRRALLRELAIVKDRLRRHGTEVTYGRRGGRPARSLEEHIADIKRRDEIERQLNLTYVTNSHR